MSARRQIIAALSEDSMGGIATLHDVAHAEQLVDAHRTEVLAADGQAYDGELAMLRGLVNTLRVITRHDGSLAEVWRLLVEHTRDDAAAREKATDVQSATATPGPTGRVAQLLDAIRTHRGEWTTKRVQDLYRLSPLSPPNAPEGRLRHVARGDLRDLHAWGHLVLHEDTGRRFYTLATRKDSHS
jgi:hypothetical protein